MGKDVVEMLESVVGLLAKVAIWAFLVGFGCGIYLGVRYWPEQPAGSGVSCVAPAPGAPTGAAPSG